MVKVNGKINVKKREEKRENVFGGVWRGLKKKKNNENNYQLKIAVSERLSNIFFVWL